MRVMPMLMLMIISPSMLCYVDAAAASADYAERCYAMMPLRAMMLMLMLMRAILIT